MNQTAGGKNTIFTGRYGRWVPLIIVAVADFVVFILVLSYIPSTSPYYTPLYYIVDALTFAAIIITWQSIRARTGLRMRNAYTSSTTFIRSTIVDDSDTEEYKQRLKEASDKYFQGNLRSDDEFYTIVGSRTPKEERIFRALSEMKAKLGEDRYDENE